LASVSNIQGPKEGPTGARQIGKGRDPHPALTGARDRDDPPMEEIGVRSGQARKRTRVGGKPRPDQSEASDSQKVDNNSDGVLSLCHWP